jgi:hypothetical protein
MIDTKENLSDAEVDPPRRVYSPDLRSLLQALLSNLATLDLEHEQECERLHQAVSETVVRDRALRRLKERHFQRCEPYIRQVTALEAQMRAGMGW